MLGRDFAAAMSVHAWAKRRFEYVPDETEHGQIEHWPSFAEIDAATAHGGVLRDDCDGFARLCQYRLERVFNLPTRILLCTVENGGGHLVCEIGGTDEAGGYVLDNRREAVTTRARLLEEGYTFLKLAKDGQWFDIQLEI